MPEEVYIPSEEDGGVGSHEQARELSEKAKKHFADNKKAQKDNQTEESKRKAKDMKLASFIIKFLKGHKYQKIASLVVRLLKENVPIEFILSVLWLIMEDDSDGSKSSRIDIWWKHMKDAAVKNNNKLKNLINNDSKKILSDIIFLVTLILEGFLKDKTKSFADLKAEVSGKIKIMLTAK